MYRVKFWHKFSTTRYVGDSWKSFRYKRNYNLNFFTKKLETSWNISHLFVKQGSLFYFVLFVNLRFLKPQCFLIEPFFQ
jgi:hypothetical protein